MSDTNNVVKILRGAAARIGAPGAWTQGAAARDSEGCVVVAEDRDAVCWCLWGGIRAEDPSRSKDATDAFLRVWDYLRSEEEQHVGSLGRWNDAEGRTQQQAVDVLNRTADRLEPTNDIS